jgi:hypothetical protein
MKFGICRIKVPAGPRVPLEHTLYSIYSRHIQPVIIGEETGSLWQDGKHSIYLDLVTNSSDCYVRWNT